MTPILQQLPQKQTQNVSKLSENSPKPPNSTKQEIKNKIPASPKQPTANALKRDSPNQSSTPSLNKVKDDSLKNSLKEIQQQIINQQTIVEQKSKDPDELEEKKLTVEEEFQNELNELYQQDDQDEETKLLQIDLKFKIAVERSKKTQEALAKQTEVILKHQQEQFEVEKQEFEKNKENNYKLALTAIKDNRELLQKIKLRNSEVRDRIQSIPGPLQHGIKKDLQKYLHNDQKLLLDQKKENFMRQEQMRMHFINYIATNKLKDLNPKVFFGVSEGAPQPIHCRSSYAKYFKDTKLHQKNLKEQEGLNKGRVRHQQSFLSKESLHDKKGKKGKAKVNWDNVLGLSNGKAEDQKDENKEQQSKEAVKNTEVQKQDNNKKENTKVNTKITDKKQNKIKKVEQKQDITINKNEQQNINQQNKDNNEIFNKVYNEDLEWQNQQQQFENESQKQNKKELNLIKNEQKVDNKPNKELQNSNTSESKDLQDSTQDSAQNSQSNNQNSISASQGSLEMIQSQQSEGKSYDNEQKKE